MRQGEGKEMGGGDGWSKTTEMECLICMLFIYCVNPCGRHAGDAWKNHKARRKQRQRGEGGKQGGPASNPRGTYHAVRGDVLDLERALEGVVIVEDGCEKGTRKM